MKHIRPDYEIRNWLNKDGGLASVYGYIFAPDEKGELASELSFNDCNRTIHLLFSVYAEQSPEQVLYKAAVLENTVKEFVAAIRQRVSPLVGA